MRTIDLLALIQSEDKARYEENLNAAGDVHLQVVHDPKP